MIRTLCILHLSMLGACTSNGGTDAGDMDARTLRDGAQANCIKPGTPSNEMGVGGYCETRTDCPGTLCTGQFGAPDDAWFCSKLCTSTAECGSNAVCFTDPMKGTACVPLVCFKDSGVEAGSDAAPDAPSDASAD